MKRAGALAFGLVLALGVLLSAGGCATVVRGGTQKMRFKTEPAMATVTVDGVNYQAPVVVPLKRNQPHTVAVSSPGYQTIQFDLDSHWDGATLGNIVLPGGSVGFGVDRLSGADRSFYKLATIKLERAPSASSRPLTMKQYRGQVLKQEQYDAAQQAERDYHSRPFGD